MHTGYERSGETGWDYDPSVGSWRPPPVALGLGSLNAQVSSLESQLPISAPEVTAGTFTSGVLLPAPQVSAGTFTSGVLLPAANVTAGTFGSGEFTFPAKLNVTGTLDADGNQIQFPSTTSDNKINLWGTAYSLGVRSNTMLFRSDRYFRFEDDATTANWMQFDTSAGGGPLLTIGNTYVGSHPVHGTAGYAGFGHTSWQGTSEYALLQLGSDGRTLLNGSFVEVRSSGAVRLVVTDALITSQVPFYVPTSMRAHNGIIEGYAPDTSYVNFHHTSIPNTSPNYQIMVRSAGHVLLNAVNDTFIQFTKNSTTCDVRFVSAPVLSGLADAGIHPTSWQIGRISSSSDYKTDIRDLEALDTLDPHNNPVWSLTPRRFRWDPARVGNANEINGRFPSGVAGLIAEEVAEVAPEAVIWADDKAEALDGRVLMAYMIAGLQHCHEAVRRLEGRAAPEGK